MNRLGTLLLGAILIGAACVAPAGGGTSVELTIYAAASLRDVLVEGESAYETVAPGVSLTVATDSSATLRTQIEQGAPADVFLSADVKNPQALVDAGLTMGPALPFAGNELTVIVPAANPAGIRAPADLANEGVAIVAAGDEVPITGYAEQLIANLAAMPGPPTDFAAAYAANVVSKEENVGAVVAKIELGEGDAAIVYATDARSAAGVTTIDIPPEANVTATYAGVVIKASAHPAEARALLEWVAGSRGAEILERFGFVSPG